MASVDQGHVLWVRRVHPCAKLPAKGTTGSAGYDLSACEDGVVKPASEDDVTLCVNVGIQVALPRGTYGHIPSKSSVARAGIDVCAGVIDNDYRAQKQWYEGLALQAWSEDRAAPGKTLCIAKGSRNGPIGPDVARERGVLVAMAPVW